MKEGPATAVCVFCGSSAGDHPGYAAAAKGLGRLLAGHGFVVVYGGSSVGLLGLVADAALEAGGQVIGVRPNRLFPGEPPHAGLTEFHEVDSLLERKRVMIELSRAFVVLPGGFGTLDELLEVLSLAHLGLHNKPIIAVDIEGFWTPLFSLISRARHAGFVKAREAGLLKRAASPEQAVAILTDRLCHSAAYTAERPG